MSHLLANPFSGGIPIIAAAPMRKANVVFGIVLAKPLSSLRFLVPSSCITAPAMRKRSAFMRAWLKV